MSRQSGVIVSMVGLWFLVLGGQPVRAQSGSVMGTVVDERGAAIPGAVVTLKNEETGQERTIVTDPQGRFRFSTLAPGQYELRVEHEGFQRAVQRGLTLAVGGEVVVDVTLKVGEITEEVLVTAAAPLLEFTKAEVSRVIDEREIDDLPIIGRNFVDFVKLSSQVAPARGNLTGGAFQEPTVAVGPAAAPRLTFGGQNERLTLIQIDGVDNSQTITGLPRATPSQEAVKEFRILNSTYAAEHGRFLAGLVNIVTRSGTDEYHGTVYYFGMNDALNARSILQRPESKVLRQHQFGFTLGGPIASGEHTFFGNYEGQRRAEGNNFSEVLLRNLAAINRIRAQFGLQPEVDTLTRTNNYDEFLIRTDHALTAKNRAMLRYNFIDSDTHNFLGGGGRASPASSTRRNAFVRDQVLVVNVVSVISPTWVNEVRFQYGRRSFAFPSILHEPALEIPNLIVMGKSTSDFDFYRESLWQGINQTSHTRGGHEVKFGFNINHYQDTSRWQLFFPARIIFAGLPGFLGLPPFPGITPVFMQWPSAVDVDVHPGFSTTWDRAVPAPWEELTGIRYDYESWGFFIQDRWRLTPHFTLNYGVRYDFDTLPTFVADRDYNNVQPRLGWAYAFARGRGVIRGGFGLFHDLKRVPAHWFHGFTVIGWGRSSPLMDLGPFNRRLSHIALYSLAGPPVAAPAFFKLMTTGQLPPNAQGLIFNITNERTLRSPYSEQASLGISYQLAGDVAISAHYLFVHGLKLPAAGTNINAIQTGTTPDGRPLLAGRRDPHYLAVLVVRNDDRSNYHGGTFSLNKRFNHHFSLNASYTISKTISLRDPAGWGLDLAMWANDPNNANLERALSNQHVGQRFVLTFLGEGPRDRLHGLLRHFKLGVITTLQSARFFTVFAGVDANQDGNPLADRPGQLGKNTFKGDGFSDLSLRVSRSFAFGERWKGEFIAEVFNLFNTVNIKNFSTVWGSADLNTPPPPFLGFGTPRDVFNPREIQFAFRLRF